LFLNYYRKINTTMTKPYFLITSSNFNLKAFNLMAIGFCTQCVFLCLFELIRSLDLH